MNVERLAHGLWWWTSSVEGRGEVASLYVERPEEIVLIDPIVPPEDRERFLRALDRDTHRHGGPVHIVLTTELGRADAEELADRCEAEVWAMSAPEGAGIETLDGGRAGAVMFWIEEHRTLFAGDRDAAEALAAGPLNIERIVCTSGHPVEGEALREMREDVADLG